MCSLCGVLGVETHFSDALPRPGVFGRAADPHRRRADRARRIEAANAMLAARRLTLSDWHGRAYLLSTATGATVLIASLAHLWPEAERLCGRAFDPLDDAFLARAR
jgi:hypothetical protein